MPSDSIRYQLSLNTISSNILMLPDSLWPMITLLQGWKEKDSEGDF